MAIPTAAVDPAPAMVGDVVAICRAIGHGTEPVDFEFASDVVNASKFPASTLVAVACRMVVDLAAEIKDCDVTEFLDAVQSGADPANVVEEG